MYFATVDWLTSTPSFRKSLCIRGAPQRGFAPETRRISALTSRVGPVIAHYDRDGDIKVSDTAVDSPCDAEHARRERVKREG